METGKTTLAAQDHAHMDVFIGQVIGNTSEARKWFKNSRKLISDGT